jgi:hypothetical protein
LVSSVDVLLLTRLTICPVLVLANISPFPPATTSFELAGFGVMLARLRVGSLTLHFTAPPRLRPPTPPSVRVQTSRSVTLISFTAILDACPMYPPTACAPCAGNWTLRVRDAGEHNAETKPDDEPTQIRSENGSIVRAVGIGFASSTVGGSCKS